MKIILTFSIISVSRVSAGLSSVRALDEERLFGLDVAAVVVVPALVGEDVGHRLQSVDVCKLVDQDLECTKRQLFA